MNYRRGGYYENTSIATYFGFGDHYFRSGTDTLAIDGHLPVFCPHFYCACTETATLEHLVKILTLPLDTVTPIS